MKLLLVLIVASSIGSQIMGILIGFLKSSMGLVGSHGEDHERSKLATSICMFNIIAVISVDFN
jgi:hypothetical protein